MKPHKLCTAMFLPQRLISGDHVGVKIPICDKILTELRRKDRNITDIDGFKENLNYVMNEYIYDYSRHSVNISASTRQGLTQIFDMVINNDLGILYHGSVTVSTYNRSSPIPTNSNPTLSYVPSHSLGIGSSLEMQSMEDIESFVDQCIVIFDEALEEIIDLLRSDSLVRFYETMEYKNLVENT